jgi:predicted RNase H-like nuclease
MYVVGVDACKKGWFAVALGRQDKWNIGIFKTIGRFWQSFLNAALIFIDIPIGLPDCSRRECDTQARKILRHRASSVFPVPCREAIQAKTYTQACRINKHKLGVKLSIQTWNISAKIFEVDRLMRHDKIARHRMKESHPELCFWALAGGHPMIYSKKSAQGFSERYSILKNIYPHTRSILHQSLDQFLRKDLARDDILDAIALAITARLSLKAIKSVPSSPPRDKTGLPMEIVYAIPQQEDMI